MQLKIKGRLTDFLSSKYIFIGLIVLSITILTAINNYYFYAYVALDNDKNTKKIRIIVNEKLALCADNNIEISACTKNIVATVDLGWDIERLKFFIDPLERYLQK